MFSRTEIANRELQEMKADLTFYTRCSDKRPVHKYCEPMVDLAIRQLKEVVVEDWLLKLVENTVDTLKRMHHSLR